MLLLFWGFFVVVFFFWGGGGGVGVGFFYDIDVEVRRKPYCYQYNCWQASAALIVLLIFRQLAGGGEHCLVNVTSFSILIGVS